jgi:hypothetical protein
MFIAIFTRVRHWNLSSVISIQSTHLPFISLKAVNNNLFYVRFALPIGLFLNIFRQKFICINLSPHDFCYMPYPSHTPSFEALTNVDEELEV